VPAVPSSAMGPLWAQFEALIPPVVDAHPLGCHRPRVPERTVFEKLVQVLGAAYRKIADTKCSAITFRRRRDKWINAGVFEQLEQLCLEAYDHIVGIEFADLAVVLTPTEKFTIVSTARPLGFLRGRHARSSAQSLSFSKKLLT
jgi:transposase